MKILTKTSNNCRYFVKQLQVIHQGWSILQSIKWHKFQGWSKFLRIYAGFYLQIGLIVLFV